MAAHRQQKRRRIRMGGSARVVALIAAVLAIFGTLAGVALAYWTSAGSGTGAATSGTLHVPTGVTASSTAGTGDVHISWTASSGATTPSGYYITRKDASNDVSPACGTSPSSTTNSTSCTDSLVPLGAYTYAVVAVLHTWTAASAPSNSVTVAQASQTITYTSTAPTDAVVTGPTYSVTAMGGGSGNPVVFSSDTPGVCTVSGATVSFPHAGTCTIDADQAGSTYYTAAPTAQQTFTVGRAAQTITFTSTVPSNATVGGPTYTVTATGGDSGNNIIFSIDAVSGSVCSISGVVVSFQHVGTCVVDADQAGNADYLPAMQAQQGIPVGPGAQAITFTSTPPSPAQVGDSYNVTATSTSGLTVQFGLDGTSSGCSLSGSTVNFTGAGTCVIDANQPGNADYLPAAQMQQSFPITKLNQTISITSTAPSAAVVGGATYTAMATATSGLTVTFSTGTPLVCTSGGTNGATFTFIAVGTCTVNANQAGNAQYNAAPQVQQSFIVGKGSQTVSFTSTAPSNAAVGGATYNATAAATSGLGAAIASSTTSVCTGSGTNSATITFVGSGQCVLTANQAGDTNWNPATQVTQSFTVSSPAATHFSVSAGPTQTAGTSFTVTITALDASNNAVTSYTGSHIITLTSTASNAPDGTAPTLPSGARTFTNGVATVTVTLVKAESGRTVTASDGTISGTSGAITVTAGAAAELAWNNVTVDAGTLSSPCLFTCIDTALGNQHNFSANVAVTDALGNVVSGIGTGHTVTVSTPASGGGSGGAFTAPTSGTAVTLSLPSSGAAISTASFTFRTQNGNWTADTFAATSSGFATASGTVTKQ